MKFPSCLVIILNFVFESGSSQRQFADQSFSQKINQPYHHSKFEPGISPPPYYMQNHRDEAYFGKEPEFMTGSQVIEAVLGDTVVLPCKINSIGDSIVLWKQGERVISAGPIQVRKDYRISLVEASSLKISEIVVADTGNYTCEIEWRGQPLQITHQLQVLVPPSVWAVMPGGPDQPNRPIEVREGDPVKLQCQADGIPPPVIRWRKPTGDIYGMETSHPQGPILHIPVVRKEHSGLYMCTASNNVGTMSADQMELRVLYPPEVSSADKTVYSGPGGRADLKCVVKADPRASVTWMLDDHQIKADHRHQIEEHGVLVVLRIIDIDYQDLGNYTCQAENNQGVARDHIELTGKPQRATINSSPEGLYRHSYNLTWTVQSLEPLTKVRILFRKMDHSTVFHENSTWSNLMLSILPDGFLANEWTSQSSSQRRQWKEYHVHSHLFQSLDADSRYEVIIQSKNRFGWSEPTKSFIFSTRHRDYIPVESYPGHHGLISAAHLTRFCVTYINPLTLCLYLVFLVSFSR